MCKVKYLKMNTHSFTYFLPDHFSYPPPTGGPGAGALTAARRARFGARRPHAAPPLR